MNRLTRVAGVFLGLTLLMGTLPTRAPAADWLNSDWSRRMELTVKPEKIAGTEELTDITLLVRATADSLGAVFAAAKTDGSDLVFTAGDGTTVLPHELVSYDSVAEDAEIWFRASTLSETENVFYLYFGNPDTTVAQTSDQAWSDDHLAVYHFDEDPGSVTQVSDSGPGDGANPALVGSGSTWSNADHVDAQIGKGWYFDGLNDWLYAQSIVSPDSSFTISAWYANVDVVNKSMIALQALTGYWDMSFARSSNDPNAGLRTEDGGMYWFPNVLEPNIHSYVWTLDAANDTARFFFDGVEQPVKVNWTVPGMSSVYMSEAIQGRVGIAGPVFFTDVDRTQGIVDEYRIREGVCTTDQVVTEFNNQSEPAQFFSYRQEFFDPVTAANPFGPRLSPGSISVWPNPFQYSAQIEVEHDDPSFRIRVFDLAGRLVRTLSPSEDGDSVTRTHWDGLDRQGRTVSSGVYYIRVDGRGGSLSEKVLVIR